MITDKQQPLQSLPQQIGQRQSQTLFSSTNQYLAQMKKYISIPPILKSKQNEMLKQFSLLIGSTSLSELFYLKRGGKQCKIFLKEKSKANNSFIIDFYYKQFFRNITIAIQNRSSPLHQCQYIMRGAYSNVYKLKVGKQNIAVKCCPLKQNKNFSKQLIDVLKQLVIFFKASSLCTAPGLTTSIGFSLIIYSECIEFEMECCQDVTSYSQQLQQDLKSSLYKLHQNKIIHFDIKPQNISYSPTYQKIIFIDFGLSEIIDEKIGEKIYSKFKGTLAYCGPQMKKCSIVMGGLIDPYYNDLICLNKTLDELRLLRINKLLFQNPNDYSQLFKKFHIRAYLLAIDYFTLQAKRNWFITTILQSDVEQCEKIERFVQEQHFLTTNRRFLVAAIQKYCAAKSKRKIHNQLINNINFSYKKDTSMQQTQISLLSTVFQQNRQSFQILQLPLGLIIQNITVESTKKGFSEKLDLIIKWMKSRQIEIDELSTQQIFYKAYKVIYHLVINETNSLQMLVMLSDAIVSFLLFKIVSEQQFIRKFQILILHNYRIFWQQDPENMHVHQIMLRIIIKYFAALQWMRFQLISQQFKAQRARLQLYQLLQQFMDKYINKQKKQFVCDYHLNIFNQLLELNRLRSMRDINIFIASFQQFHQNCSYQPLMVILAEYFYSFISRLKQDVNEIQSMQFLKLKKYILQKTHKQKIEMKYYYLDLYGFITKLSLSEMKPIFDCFSQYFSQFSFSHNYILHYIPLSISHTNKQLIEMLNTHFKGLLPDRQDSYLQYKTFSQIFLLQSFVLTQLYKNQVSKYSTTSQFLRNNKEFQLIFQQRYLQLMNDINHEKYYEHRKLVRELILFFWVAFHQQRGEKYQQSAKRIGEIKVFYKRFVERESCIICKTILYTFYQYLQCVDLIFLGNHAQSIMLYEGLILFMMRQRDLIWLLDQIIMLYFRFSPYFTIQLLNKFIRLTWYLITINKNLLLAIIIRAPNLYYQIFREILLTSRVLLIQILIFPSIRFLHNSACNYRGIFLFNLLIRCLDKFLEQRVIDQQKDTAQILKLHVNNQLLPFIQYFDRNNSINIDAILIYCMGIMRAIKFKGVKAMALCKFACRSIDYFRNDLKDLLLYLFFSVLLNWNESGERCLKVKRFWEKIKSKYSPYIVFYIKTTVLTQRLKKQIRQSSKNSRDKWSCLYKKSKRYNLL